jgi:Retrotransposon gag protein
MDTSSRAPAPAKGAKPNIQYQMPVVVPFTLTAAIAADKMEDWFYQLARMFNQLQISEQKVKERLQIALQYVEVDIALWWEDYAKGQTKNLACWDNVKAVFIQTFVPVGRAQHAYNALWDIKQLPHENMHDFFTRVNRHRTAAALGGHHLEEAACTQLVMRAFRSVDFPRTMGKLKERHLKKKFTVLSQLREFVTRYELTEAPKQHPPTEQKPPRGRVAAIARTSSASRDDRICAKCGEKGHGPWDCRSKVELRVCYACNQQGHLRDKCTAPPKPPSVIAPGGSPASSPAPKNGNSR